MDDEPHQVVEESPEVRCPRCREVGRPLKDMQTVSCSRCLPIEIAFGEPGQLTYREAPRRQRRFYFSVPWRRWWFLLIAPIALVWGGMMVRLLYEIFTTYPWAALATVLHVGVAVYLVLNAIGALVNSTFIRIEDGMLTLGVEPVRYARRRTTIPIANIQSISVDHSWTHRGRAGLRVVLRSGKKTFLYMPEFDDDEKLEALRAAIEEFLGQATS